MVEIERREFLEGAYLRVSFLLFRKKMPLQDGTNTQTRSNNSEIEVSKKEEEVKMTGVGLESDAEAKEKAKSTQTMVPVRARDDVYILMRNKSAWNMDGSEDAVPPFGGSWIRYWKSKTGKNAGRCSFVSCEAEAEVGVMYGLLVEMGLISLPYIRGAIGVKTRSMCRGVGLN